MSIFPIDCDFQHLYKELAEFGFTPEHLLVTVKLSYGTNGWGAVGGLGGANQEVRRTLVSGNPLRCGGAFSWLEKLKVSGFFAVGSGASGLSTIPRNSS
jgi:hypothetical protein